MKKDKKQPKAIYGIYIAGTVPKTAKKLERAVMKVLECNAGDEIKKEALRVMANALATSASISGCQITSGQ